MDFILNNAFGNVKKLWSEFFKFKVLKRIPKWCAIILFIFAVPFLLCGLFGTGIYAAVYFLFYIISVPTTSLHKILSKEGKEVHFVTQALIYFACFPLIFMCYFFLVFLLPILFIQYFFINVYGYIASYGGIKFEAFLDKERGEKEVSTDPIQKAVWIPYFSVAAYFFACAAIFFIVFISEADVLGFGVCSLLFMFTIAIGCFVLKIVYKRKQKVEKPVAEAEKAPEAKEEAPVEEEKAEVVEKPKKEKKPHEPINKERIFHLIFAGAALILTLLAFILCLALEVIDSNTTVAEYLGAGLLVLPLIVSVVSVGFAVLYLFLDKKWVRLVSIITSIVGAGLLLVLSVVALIDYIISYPSSWNFDAPLIVIYIIAGIASAIAVVEFFIPKFFKKK